MVEQIHCQDVAEYLRRNMFYGQGRALARGDGEVFVEQMLQPIVTQRDPGYRGTWSVSLQRVSTSTTGGQPDNAEQPTRSAHKSIEIT
jgi:hypothetical protein